MWLIRVDSVTKGILAGCGISDGGRYGWPEEEGVSVKVLIADDDPTIRTMLARLLCDLDCAVTEVENGVEALGQLNKFRYSMLLLDVHMPVMGGLETLEVVRRSGPHRSLPVVMISADRDEAVVKRAVALGITDYLVKPFTAEGTGQRLEHVLGALTDERPADLELRH